ncbi:hypothetical protein [Streptacidiphilus sp. EB129]|uniref:hypothetical protein n=1 Tax=Streptacidiphilus sp. EB129 TaxID=3156262 RepID=UPI0035177A3E
MNETSMAASGTQDQVRRAHIVVHGLGIEEDPPYRRVEIGGISVGKAYALEDVAEFVGRAGIEAADLTDPKTVWWDGGGPDHWG